MINLQNMLDKKNTWEARRLTPRIFLNVEDILDELSVRVAPKFQLWRLGMSEKHFRDVEANG